jgi:hypothetical protein
VGHHDLSGEPLPEFWIDVLEGRASADMTTRDPVNAGRGEVGARIYQSGSAVRDPLRPDSDKAILAYGGERRIGCLKIENEK